MPKALPGTTTAPETHERVRHDRVDKAGSVTLRHHSRLHHIGVDRTHAGTCLILLIQNLQIRVVNAATGELLRELILGPCRDYQLRSTQGPHPQTLEMNDTQTCIRRSGCRRCPETSH